MLVLRPIENAFIGRQRAAIEHAVRCGFALTIDTPAAADDVARIAVNCDRRALVNVMVDTGMTRGGCPVDRLNELLWKIESRSSLKLVGPLPADVQNYTSYGAALMRNAPSPDAAKAFMAFLGTPTAKEAFISAGIE